MADTTIERINIDIQVTSASAEQRIKRLEDALDALKRASEEATEGASAAASGVGHSASHAAHRISTLEKGLHKVRNAVLSVPKYALSKAFSAAIAPVKSLERSVSSVSSRISSTFAALKRIAIYRLMRTMIKELTQGLKEGIQNLYKWSEYVGTRFHSSMDSMATSALYIKNSLATIAEPILNFLAPAIDLLADHFAALAATVAEFLAALTGQDQYTIALKFPKKYGEEAEKTAKAMQKWLGPFDEINRLSDPNKGGKGLDLDWTKMFETMKVEGTGPIGEFVKKLKEGFKQGDLTEIGTILSDKLQQAMEGLDWPKIKKKARTLASSIGTFIMGFFKGGGFTTKLGKTIAQALNTAINFASTLKDTLDFAELGKSLGQGIQSFLNTFDFGKAIGTIVDWGVGFVTLLSSAISEVNWEDFGKKIGEGIRDVDWYKTFKAIFGLGSNILKGLFDVVIGITADGTLGDVFEGFGKAVGEALADKELWKKAFQAALGLGGAIVQGFAGFLSGAISGLTGADIDIEFDESVAESIFSAIFAGISAAKILKWIGLGGGAGGSGGGLGGGGAAGVVGIGGAIATTIIETMKYADWHAQLSDRQKQFLRELTEQWASDGTSAYFGEDAFQQAYLAHVGGESFADWGSRFGYEPGLYDYYPEGLSDPEALAEAQEAIQQFTTAGQALGEAFAPIGQIVGGAFTTIKKAISGADEKQQQMTKHAPQMKAAMERSAKGIGRASEEIDRHASATRKKFNLMEKGLDNFKKKASSKHPLGEDRLAKSAKYIKDWADVDVKHIDNVGKKTDALKKKFSGKNPLGENKFGAATKSINNSAKAAGDAIARIGTKSSTAAATLKSKMSEAETAVGTFKNRSLTKLNQFAEGINSGMGTTMEDFAAESKGALDTMLRNYSFFASETARLMSDTSATYSGSGLLTYRSGGGGGGGHQKPFTEQQYMANGGFVDNGQMFIARESGPELVGTMGNRNAVANNAQIVAGIAAGVSEANEDVVNAIYSSINQVIGVIRENRSKNGAVNWDAVSRQINRVQKRQAASAYM